VRAASRSSTISAALMFAAGRLRSCGSLWRGFPFQCSGAVQPPNDSLFSVPESSFHLAIHDCPVKTPPRGTASVRAKNSLRPLKAFQRPSTRLRASGPRMMSSTSHESTRKTHFDVPRNSSGRLGRCRQHRRRRQIHRGAAAAPTDTSHEGPRLLRRNPAKRNLFNPCKRRA